MSDLKTYKDFEKMSDHLEIDHTTLWAVKQEAIKHIKDLQNSYMTINSPSGYEIAVRNAQREINWIKYFFNITEEDL